MVAERSGECNVFARSEAGIVGTDPTQGIGVQRVYHLVCVRVDLITCPGSPTLCKNDQ
jgi:hypothetical protein